MQRFIGGSGRWLEYSKKVVEEVFHHWSAGTRLHPKHPDPRHASPCIATFHLRSNVDVDDCQGITTVTVSKIQSNGHSLLRAYAVCNWRACTYLTLLCSLWKTRFRMLAPILTLAKPARTRHNPSYVPPYDHPSNRASPIRTAQKLWNSVSSRDSHLHHPPVKNSYSGLSSSSCPYPGVVVSPHVAPISLPSL